MGIEPMLLSKNLGTVQTFKRLPYRAMQNIAVSGDIFQKSCADKLSIENELIRLKYDMSDYLKKSNALKKGLDKSFGDDWVFCYGDLTDKQSDMYIDFFRNKDLAAKCREKIAMLTQKLEQLGK